MLDPALDTDEKRIVAVLHDTLEDTRLPIWALTDLGLNSALLYSVVCLTHKINEPLEHYYKRILSDPSGIAREVKLADIRHNMARMKCLNLEDQKRLKKKYQFAVGVLNADKVKSVLVQSPGEISGKDRPESGRS